MKKQFCGSALVLGDNIDTDQIFPGRLLEITDHEEIGRHCFWGIDEAIAENFPRGGIVVAGKNFGCGSSREHAAIAIEHLGASAVIAESFARIFYRNGINLGLPLVECKGIVGQICNGEKLTVDLENGYIEAERSGKKWQVQPFNEEILSILESGGIKPYMRKRFSGKGEGKHDKRESKGESAEK